MSSTAFAAASPPAMRAKSNSVNPIEVMVPFPVLRRPELVIEHGMAVDYPLTIGDRSPILSGTPEVQPRLI